MWQLCRLRGSDDGSFDGVDEITVALQRCSQSELDDSGCGDHPLSQAMDQREAQGHSMQLQQRRSDAMLSSGHSSHSVASIMSADQPQGAARQPVLLQPENSDQGQSRFMKKLQEFQKGTDRLQKQVSLG